MVVEHHEYLTFIGEYSPFLQSAHLVECVRQYCQAGTVDFGRERFPSQKPQAWKKARGLSVLQQKVLAGKCCEKVHMGMSNLQTVHQSERIPIFSKFQP